MILMIKFFEEMNDWHWLICNENFTLELMDVIPSPAMLQSAPWGQLDDVMLVCVCFAAGEPGQGELGRL